MHRSRPLECARIKHGSAAGLYFKHRNLLVFETGLLRSPGCPRTNSVDQAGINSDLPASAASALGLKACATAQLHRNVLLERELFLILNHFLGAAFQLNFHFW